MTKRDLKTYWGVRYFYTSAGRWMGCRVYPDVDKAVDDFLKLVAKDEIGAVRLYGPGKHYYDNDFLCQHEKLDQGDRRAAARMAGEHTL